jgi:ribosomal protein S18 acetylase RimI-like enzyme
MDIYPQVLPAKVSDASLVSRILIRSFRAGCALDHRNNPLLVNAWLRRHSAEQVSVWLSDRTAQVEVAWLQGKPVGVGMVRNTGEVSLCYVLPEFFRRGVGQSLMKSLERHLARIGRARVLIYSTLTGQGFYQHLGYRENGQALRVASVPLRPMHKPLPPLDT